MTPLEGAKVTVGTLFVSHYTRQILLPQDLDNFLIEEFSK